MFNAKQLLQHNSISNRQLDLRPMGCAAGYCELCADSRGPLAHACQAPMSFPPCMEHAESDSTSVSASPHAQVSVSIFKFQLHALCTGMTKSVDQGLPANAVNLVLDRRPQRLLLPDDIDVKVHTVLGRKFLVDRRQSDNQIPSARVRRTETLNCIPAFLYPQLQDVK